jgi:hypothetical protein
MCHRPNNSPVWHVHNQSLFGTKFCTDCLLHALCHIAPAGGVQACSGAMYARLTRLRGMRMDLLSEGYGFIYIYIYISSPADAHVTSDVTSSFSLQAHQACHNARLMQTTLQCSHGSKAR